MSLNFSRALLKCENTVCFKYMRSVFPMLVRNLAERRVSKRILAYNEDELQQRSLAVTVK